jgi:septum site-determining protein MinC
MTETRPSLISIKGIRQGLLFTIADSPAGWEDVRQALLEHIDQQGEFLHGARIALDVGNYVLKAVDLGQLRDALSERELFLWAVMSNSPTTEQTAQTMGLDVRIDKPKSAARTKEVALQGGEEAAMFHRTLRSGFRLQYAGHVVVIGDVNPGAEIIAGGNIVVWGRLGGLVHAGASGDEDAVVCALDLHPTQLRIADQIAITPQRKGKPQPEIARLKDGKVVAEVWNPKGKK